MSESQVGEGPAPPQSVASLRKAAAYGALSLLIIVVYVAAGRAGLALGLVNPSVTPIWPGTGIAIAALLILGLRFWPPIFLGAFIVNVLTTGEPMSSLLIGAGNAAEALVVASLLGRFADGPSSFLRAAGVFLFVGATAFAAALSATVGTVSLWSVGRVTTDSVATVWTNWWVGNLAGALLVAPVLCLWARPLRPELRLGRWVEAGVLLGLVLTVAFDPAGILSGPTSAAPPMGFVVIPLIVWAAFRFSPREAATGTFVLAFGAFWRTVNGHGPYAVSDAALGQLTLGLALSAIAFVSLVLAALVADRRREEGILRRARDELEARVGERTESLSVAVERLRKEVIDRERAEDDLRQQVELNDSLLRAQSELGDGVSITQGQQIVYVNDALCRMYGYTREELLAIPSFIQLVVPEDRERLTLRLQQRLAGKELSDRGETVVVRKDGQRIDVEYALKVMVSGNERRLFSIIRDVTQRRKAEAEHAAHLAQLAEISRLKEVDEFKTQFINTAAHELATPLTPIRVQLHLLRDRPELQASSDVRHTFEVLDRNLQRVIGLVQDILDAARLQAARLGIQRRPVDLRTLVREAVESFEPSAQQASVQIMAALETELHVMADPDRISQVLYNLLSNALKFTPRGGRITLEAKPAAKSAQIAVRDTGEGLTAAQMAELFRPFAQVHEPRESARGTGLGLYICKGILELHGGRIWCESPGPGRGSTFYFTVPLAEATTSVEAAVPAA